MDMAQQLKPIRRYHARECLPVLEGQVVFRDVFTGFVPRDGVQDSRLRVREPATDMDLQSAHILASLDRFDLSPKVLQQPGNGHERVGRLDAQDVFVIPFAPLVVESNLPLSRPAEEQAMFVAMSRRVDWLGHAPNADLHDRSVLEDGLLIQDQTGFHRLIMA
jgi:hypothetical protein